MKISIIKKEKDEKFYTRTEPVTIYKNIISAKYADEVNKVKEDFTLTFIHNRPKFNELDSVKRLDVSVSTIKRFRFHDQTFPFLRSNVSVSTIKRFLYIVITVVFLR